MSSLKNNNNLVHIWNQVQKIKFTEIVMNSDSLSITKISLRKLSLVFKPNSGCQFSSCNVSF